MKLDVATSEEARAFVDPILRDWQMEVTAIPAPPFGEQERTQWISSQFSELGLDDVDSDELGNVFGILGGEEDEKFLAVSAHIDTVFPAGTKINVRSDGDRLRGPGIGDNAAGITALLALASV